MTSSADGGAALVDVFVVGAHLEGQPLCWQLTDRGAELVSAARTAERYRLVALTTDPPKPGLVRVVADGASIVGERWRLPVAGFGAFVAAVPSPLCIGKVLLDDGELVAGFLCEVWATEGATDITGSGGWRAHLAAGGDGPLP